jgi:lipoprotein-anchoring transpeptidase ErfK/SrfK
MTDNLSKRYEDLISKAHDAIYRGDRNRARILASQAAKLSPNKEEAWLLLASIASPKAAIDYSKKALNLFPNSKEAQKTYTWAVNRRSDKQSLVSKPVKKGIRLTNSMLLPFLSMFLIIAFGLISWRNIPKLSEAINSVPTSTATSPIINTNRGNSVLTNTATDTPTSTNTPTPTNTPTNTPTATNTPTQTFTPSPTYPLPTPVPTSLTVSNGVRSPAGVTQNEVWIDVNLSQQKLYVYRGNTLLNSFIVSTGTSSFPTVTGQYRIYIKLVSQTMSGPGYFLPDVPYVMYFYQGYALHGTYWHSNFGTQMSHGCVNMKTSDVEWIFSIAQIGTWVQVHY